MIWKVDQNRLNPKKNKTDHLFPDGIRLQRYPGAICPWVRKLTVLPADYAKMPAMADGQRNLVAKRDGRGVCDCQMVF
ncbi:hypothetical protein TH468_20645 [Thalassospira sp. MCCC 1A03138]|nr:hypothetical protein TH468_20645 [Thalassospira sp. MCCC 1A03138]